MTPESATAVYTNIRAKTMFTAFLKESFFRLLRITVPTNAQVDVAAKAVIAKRAANNANHATCPETAARKVE